MDQIIVKDGSTSMIGRDAVEVFRLAALISSLKLEMKGLKMSRGMSALKVAKGITGLKTNNRELQIAAVQKLLAVAHTKVEHIDETTGGAK